MQPRRGGLFGLQMVAFEAGPALQRIVVPGAAGQVFVHVEIAVRENVEPGAFLVADQRRHGVLELLAEVNVEHAGVQRPPPHAHVEPAGARERSGGGAGQNQIGGSGEHGFPRIRIVIQFSLADAAFATPSARESRLLYYVASWTNCWQRGIHLFNSRQFFECHEVWEEVWTPERGPRRLFLQSLIHFAVGLYHTERGNPVGAGRQLRKGLRKLGRLPALPAKASTRHACTARA